MADEKTSVTLVGKVKIQPHLGIFEGGLAPAELARPLSRSRLCRVEHRCFQPLPRDQVVLACSNVKPRMNIFCK